MRKWLMLVPVILLCSCADEVPEPVVEATPEPLPLREISADAVLWEGYTVEPLTPCGAFEYAGRDLYYYPYHDSTESLYLSKIFTSENHFWSTVIEEYKGSENYKSEKEYDIVALSSTYTVAYKELDEESAVVVVSGTLPSGYVETMMKQLCQ